ncbi:MAG: NAD(P)H-dependent oxidoreductase subunit E [Deltaproteobacteria bacterium]|nr:NAD(P)H-dependent oxidoreductase subunit E [Deltaproteobacteria bacterium]
MALSFSKESEEQIRKLLPKYPTKMAACLPLLWLAQEDFGWISEDAMKLVAERLDLSLGHVYGVATFYTMYNKKPVGHYHVQVCTNVTCMICGAYDVLSAFEKELGIKSGETSDDELFTLQEVECLGACGGAVCVQVDKDYHENILPEKVPEFVASLRAAAPAERKKRSVGDDTVGDGAVDDEGGEE